MPNTYEGKQNKDKNINILFKMEGLQISYNIQ